VPGIEFWLEALRVAKPGAHLLAFGGTRTFHRLACAIEDAGWEIRDTVMWVYGSGFPKSHNMKGDWDGWGTALKPAWEPIIVARKPIECTVAQNVLEYGTGAINIDGCRVGTDGATKRSCQAEYPKKDDGTEDRSGCWARTGHTIESMNIGRWPANLIHDGSEEVTELFPQTSAGHYSGKVPANGGLYKLGLKNVPDRGYTERGTAARFFYCAKASKQDRDEGCEGMEARESPKMAGADRETRPNANNDVSDRFRTQPAHNFHPTVKPTALMRYLCKLVTPPNGTVFDPFMGSGSTGKAAVLEGFSFIGCDTEAEYVKIAEARINATMPLFVEAR